MSFLEDIDLTPPETAQTPDNVRYLHENFARIKSELSGGADADNDGWTALTLLNGWVRFDTNWPIPHFRTHPGGLIEIQGLIKDGTTATNTALFLMPVGARPLFRQFFAIAINGGIGSIFFDQTDNQVKISTAAATWISINIMFYADDYAAT